MPKKAQPEKAYFVYTLVNGTCMAVHEIGVISGKSTKVLYPTTVVMRDDQSGFVFSPLRYVTGEFELFLGGAVLGRSAMPDIMIPFYEQYLVEQKK